MSSGYFLEIEDFKSSYQLFTSKQKSRNVLVGSVDLNGMLCASFITLKLYTHRRRINTEEKANVIAAVRGTEFIQFLAR